MTFLMSILCGRLCGRLYDMWVDLIKVYMTQKVFSCLFETPFKIQKNGIFLFEISFFVLEIFDGFLLCKLDQ